MTNVRLKDIASIHGGGRLKLSGNHFVTEGVPAYGAGGQNGFVATAEYADREAVILSSIGARCGKCFHVSGAWTSLANTQVILPDPSRVDPKFLWFQLNEESRWPRSGSAQPFIKPSDVKAHEVWLPPLDEQRRIAMILDQADALRAKRGQTISHLDDLIQSLFIEMFGDPAVNPHGWEFATLNDLSTEKGSYGANVPSVAYSSDLPRYVRITDVTGSGALTSDRRSPGGKPEDWERHELAENDLLFARSGATVGKTYLHARANGRCVYAGYLIRFRVREEVIDPRFLFAFTKTQAYFTWVKNRQNVVAQPNINAKQYGNDLLVPVPPLARQHEFSRRLAGIERSQGAAIRAADLESELLQSLQSRAFQGDL